MNYKIASYIHHAYIYCRYVNMKSNINHKIIYIHVNVIRTTIQCLHVISLQI